MSKRVWTNSPPPPPSSPSLPLSHLTVADGSLLVVCDPFCWTTHRWWMTTRPPYAASTCVISTSRPIYRLWQPGAARPSGGQLEPTANWPKSLSPEEEATRERREGSGFQRPWGGTCLYLDCMSGRKKGYGTIIMSHFLSTHTHTHRQRCIFPFQIELQRPDWIFLLCIKDKKAGARPLPPALSSLCFHPSTLDLCSLSASLNLPVVRRYVPSGSFHPWGLRARVTAISLIKRAVIPHRHTGRLVTCISRNVILIVVGYFSSSVEFVLVLSLTFFPLWVLKGCTD